MAARGSTPLWPILLVLTSASSVLAQTAELSGTVRDSSGAAFPHAAIAATSEETTISWTTTSNGDGYYNIPFLKPGSYSVAVDAPAFRRVVQPEIVLEAGQRVRLDVFLEPAPVAQTVTVEGGVSPIRLDYSAVSTTITTRLVDNLPLNGRTFQPLIGLVPGVTAANSDGQFSTNGQRDDANYFTVDGVSANIGLSNFRNLGETGGGSIPTFNVLGGTHNLAALDAIQEFTVQTSTYAADLGRMPGAQVQVVTRSGTNRFRGSLFDYFRNDALDANDWFVNQKGLQEPPLNQHDVGGILGGPILRSRTFFFLSYEGLHLTLPQFGVVSVPSRAARQRAPAAIQQLLNAFPLPNGPEDAITMLGEFSASYPNTSSAHAASFRLDHAVGSGLRLFGRYSEARSDADTRADALTHLVSDQVNTRFVTAGATIVLSQTMVNELRANYSDNRSRHLNSADDFGGAMPPPDSLLFPAPFASPDSSRFIFSIDTGPRFVVGRSSDHQLEQVNLVDRVSVLKGAHALGFGGDFRHLPVAFGPQDYGLGIRFLTVPQAVSGRPPIVSIFTFDPVTLAFNNLSVYAQDKWRATRRLTLDIGLRWELNPAPHTTDGQTLYTLGGLGNPATLRLAPAGTALYPTSYDNFAPRLGASYQLSDAGGIESVVRGGFGVFYDLGTGVVGQATESFPHFLRKFATGQPFPLDPAVAAPPAEPSLIPPYVGQAFLVFSTDHVLPRTYEWNLSLEQQLGARHTLTVSYVGAAGRDLLRRVLTNGPGPNFTGGSTIDFTTNSATSDYRALQIQFQNRFFHGLQVLGSYTLAHSTDTASSDVLLQGTGSGNDVGRDRGPSDFDVRHSVQAALTYDIPATHFGRAIDTLLRDWSINTIVLVRTATPVDVTITRSFGQEVVSARPDPVPGQPFYVDDPTVAGGRRINAAAFTVPIEQRQGLLERNALRGVGLAQADLGLGRTLRLTKGTNVQLKAEFFNLFNHPNFANPTGFLGAYVPPLVPNTLFGVSTQMANNAGVSGVTNGLTSLYRTGGPRSIQLSARFGF